MIKKILIISLIVTSTVFSSTLNAATLNDGDYMDVETTSTISTSCGSKISFYPRNWYYCAFQQNIKQLKATYGEDDYITILDNAHNKLYLLAGDNDTRKWFSEQLGTYTIISKNISGKDYDEMSVSQSEESKDLMSAYELNLNPMGQVIGAITKMNPIKMQLRPAFQFMQNQPTTTKEFFSKNGNNNLHNQIENIEEIIL